LFIALPPGNRPIDQLTIYLHDGRLLDGYEANFDEAINFHLLD
jgi:hypothetical protein